MLAMLAVWCAGNLILWTALFGVAALSDVPVLWRLVAGVFANFYLMHLGRTCAARIRDRLTA